MPSDDDGTDFGSNGSDSEDPLDVISSSQPRTDTMPSGDDGHRLQVRVQRIRER